MGTMREKDDRLGHCCEGLPGWGGSGCVDPAVWRGWCREQEVESVVQPHSEEAHVRSSHVSCALKDQEFSSLKTVEEGFPRKEEPLARANV